MIRTYSEDEKIEYVEEFKKRDVSQSEFCREKSIPESTFRGWLQQEKNMTFGEINLKSHEETRMQETVKRPMIFSGDNIRIELREGFNKEFLRNIVEVMINAN